MAEVTLEEIEAAKKEIQRSVQAFVDLATRGAPMAHPFVSGWVVFTEFRSVETEAQDVTAGMHIVAEGQSPAMSRGLFDFGVESFVRQTP